MTDSLARPANTRSAAHPERKRPARRAQSERREEATNTILDAAEKLFALHGRDGVTLKAIATGANVDTALFHYYFGDKDRVFRAVFARRSGEVNAARIAAMDAYEAQVGTDMTIEGVLDIFLRPIYEMVIDKGEGWVYFAAIVGHANASHFGGKDVMAENFDPIVQRFIDMLRALAPEAPPERIYWFFDLVSSSLTHGLAQTGRIDDVSGGLCKSSDLGAALETMITVFSEGFRSVGR
ncbi:MAG: TetR/AcrR family transcriptional regulator [Phenylobacterium sp.]|nr:TetR/AcrR family transcriptional regulator [Phenylobacterium sp.]